VLGDNRVLRDKMGVSFVVFGVILLAMESMVLFVVGINLGELFTQLYNGFASASGIGPSGSNIVEQGTNLLIIMSTIYRVLALIVTCIPLLTTLIGIYLLTSKPIKE